MRFCLAFTVLFLCTGGGWLHGNTLEVRRSGALQHTVNTARPGDTVVIHPGRYEEGVTVNKPLTLKADEPGTVIIGKYAELPNDGFVFKDGIYAISFPENIYAIYQDKGTHRFIHHGFSPARDLESARASANRFFYDEREQTLYINPQGGENGDYFKEGSFGAALLPAGLFITNAEDVTVEGLRFEHCGIHVNRSKNVVIRDTAAGRVAPSFAARVNFSENVLLENCVFFDSMGGIHIYSSKEVSVNHCTVYRTRAHGVFAERDSSASVTNSIIYASGVGGSIYYIRPEAVDFKSDHNNLITYAFPVKDFRLFYHGTSYEDMDAYRKGSGNDANSISADPLFVSETYGRENFFLRQESPCKAKAMGGKDMGILNYGAKWWEYSENKTVVWNKPAILFLSGRVTEDPMGRPSKYRVRGFIPDATLQDNIDKWGYEWTVDFLSTKLTLDYLKQFNGVVLMNFPIPHRHGGIDDTLIRNAIDLLHDYVREGGGLLLTGITEGGQWAFDQDVDEMNRFLRPFDASVHKEQVLEKNPLLIRKSVFGRIFEMAWTNNISIHPVTAGVEGFLYPVTPGSMAHYTRPVTPGSSWQTLLKGSPTAHSAKFGLGGPDRYVSTPGKVESEPVLLAVRDYEKGRIALWPTVPTATIIDGYHRFWGGGATMKPMDSNFPSYGEILLYNMFEWLTEPSMGLFGGFEKEVVAEEEEEIGFIEIDWDRVQYREDYKQYPHTFKGIIGLKSSLSDGRDTPEALLAAAKEAGYDFAAFSENLAKLDAGKLRRLNEVCAKFSDADFQAFPGFTYIHASGNKWQVFDRQIGWPQDNWWHDKEKRIINDNNVVFRGYGLPPVIMVHPNNTPEKPWYQGNFKGIAVYTYENGRLVDDASEIYKYLQANNFSLFPVTINFVRTADEVKHSAVSPIMHTYVPWLNLEDIIVPFRSTSIRYQGRWYWQRPHFVSSGPGVEAFIVRNFGTSDLAIPGNDRFRMFLNLSSEAGLEEVNILDRGNTWRRFLPAGEKQWSVTLDGFHSENHNFIVFARDKAGGKTVSSSCNTAVQEINVPRCTDNYNTFYAGKWKAVPVFPIRGVEHYIDRQAEAFSRFPAVPGIMETIRPAVEQQLTHISRFGFIRTDILNDYYPETATPNWNKTDNSERAESQDSFTRKARLTLFTPWADSTVAYLVEGEFNTLKDLQLSSRRVPVFTGRWVAEADTYTVSRKDGTSFTESIKPWAGGSLTGMLDGAWYVANLGAEGGSRAVVPLTEGMDYRGITRNHETYYMDAGLLLDKPELSAGEGFSYRYLAVFSTVQAPANNEFVEDVVNKLGIKGNTSYSVYPETGKVLDTKFILHLEAQDYGFTGRFTRSNLPMLLPVFIDGLNERWPAGIFYRGTNRLVIPVWRMDREHNRYSARQEQVFENPVFRFGIVDGRGMLQVDTETADRNVYIGNLLVCDNPEVFLELEDTRPGKETIAANNPTDRPVTVTVRPGPGFDLLGAFAKQVTIPAGGMVRFNPAD